MTEPITWIDPVFDGMPDADTEILVRDRFGKTIIASWDDNLRCWVQTMITPYGEFTYPWPEAHCQEWAHMPESSVRL